MAAIIRKRRRLSQEQGSRRGAVLVFCILVLLVMFYMAAFAIDVGYMVLSKAELQNATDAACLAATLELGAALDAEDIEDNAKDMALFVASLNTVSGQPLVLNRDDVELGERASDGTSVFGGEGPYNAVRVTGLRTEANDNPLPLYWARVIGHDTADITAQSLGVLTPRDLAFVLDVSGSMGDDTNYNPSLQAGQSSNMEEVFDDIFGDGTSSSNPTVGSGGWPGYLWRAPDSRNSNYQWLWNNARNRLLNNSNISANQQFDFDRWFPDGWNSDLWRAYCEYCYGDGEPGVITTQHDFSSTSISNAPADFWRVNDWNDGIQGTQQGGTNRTRYFGHQTFVQFLIRNAIGPVRGGTRGGTPGDHTTFTLFSGSGGGQSNASTPTITDIGIGPYVRIQPIHAVRQGAKAGIQAVQAAGSVGVENDFDRVSVSSFGTRGTWLAADSSTIVYGADDIATAPVHLHTELTNDYATAEAACDRLFPHGMGGPGYTNIGDAIQDGVWLLNEGNNSREFSNKAIALLTDGAPTAGSYSGSTGIPAGSWTNNQKWALYNAHLAAEEDIRIHTIALGAGADPALMSAIADMTGGEFYDLRFVTPANRQAAINDAFETIGKDRLGKLFRFTAPD